MFATHQVLGGGCFRVVLLIGFLAQFFSIIYTVQKCDKSHKEQLRFKLIKQCKRSTQKVIMLENTQTLEECIALAKEMRGLAFNYAPQARRNRMRNRFKNKTEQANNFNYIQIRENRAHFLSEPHLYFSCHILECPENSTLRTMVNDSRFDYFSLYEPLSSTNYSCLPGVGIVQLQTMPLSYLNASAACRNSSLFIGALAHITSEHRTNAISAQLRTYNAQRRVGNVNVHASLAFVGLFYNRSYVSAQDFHTANNESLNCYLYRAWAPGYPKRILPPTNTSCVAITIENTWVNLDCERKLPYFCEVYTLPYTLMSDFEISATNADQCVEYLN